MSGPFCSSKGFLSPDQDGPVPRLSWSIGSLTGSFGFVIFHDDYHSAHCVVADHVHPFLTPVGKELTFFLLYGSFYRDKNHEQ